MKKNKTRSRQLVDRVGKYPQLYIFFYSCKQFCRRLLFGQPVKIHYFKDLRICYLSITKNASTSLAILFCQKLHPGRVYPNSVQAHRDLDEFEQPLQTIRKINSLKFTVVRNPYERIVSCYNDKICHPRYHLIYDFFWLFKPKMQFDLFIRNLTKIPDRLSDIHLVSQSFRIKDSSLFDKILRYENINDEWTYIAKKHDLSPLPHRNKTTKKKDWRDYYTHKTAKLVYKRYKKDFDTWYPDAYSELQEYLNTK